MNFATDFAVSLAAVGRRQQELAAEWRRVREEAVAAERREGGTAHEARLARWRVEAVELVGMAEVACLQAARRGQTSTSAVLIGDTENFSDRSRGAEGTVSHLETVAQHVRFYLDRLGLEKAEVIVKKPMKKKHPNLVPFFVSVEPGQLIVNLEWSPVADSCPPGAGRGLAADGSQPEPPKGNVVEPCGVCGEEALMSVLVPCGHLLCTRCAAGCGRACPFCRGAVRGSVGLFRPSA